MAGQKGRSGGSNRKPTRLKLLEGNRGRRALNHREPRPKVGLPAKPRDLGAVASAEWNAMGPALVALGVLTTVDGAAFAGYCTLYARAVKLRKAITARPAPVIFGQANPLYAMEDKALKSLVSYLAQFGLTPSTRSKIIAAQEQGNDAKDPWAAGA